ncbi:MAG: YciI family protein [Ruegeria sp.]
MLIALIARDKDDALQTRLDNRAAHLAYIEATGVVSQAGPLLNGDAMIGSLIILDVDSLEAAQVWADNDPYANAGLFKSVELIPWKKVVG